MASGLVKTATSARGSPGSVRSQKLLTFGASQIGVLVADDEMLVSLMLKSGLSRHGFRVWLAPGGREAIDVYRDQCGAIAIALLDVQMRELDGPQTMDALHELEPELPVCLMSGDTGDYSEEELHVRGTACLFHKPFLLAEVADSMRQLVKTAASGHS